MTNMEQLGHHLRNLRHANSWTRDRVAKLMNDQDDCEPITAVVIGYIERGRRTTMPISWLAAFATIYRVTADDLLGADCPGCGKLRRPLPAYLTCRVCETRT